MIPKIIHYCWFGNGKIPALGEKCIASWKKFFPDYEIKLWNEDNFDVNIIPYTSQAYKAKKFAFVSDYARFWVLYKYGGVYFDTDVEVINSMDSMIDQGAFMGAETSVNRGERLYVAPGLGMASPPAHPFIKECLEMYEKMTFTFNNGEWTQTICEYITELLEAHGLKQIDDIQTVCGFNIYPCDYMCPISTKGYKKRITPNTVSIHHYAASWASQKKQFKNRIARLIGPNLTLAIINIKRFFLSHDNHRR